VLCQGHRNGQSYVGVGITHQGGSTPTSMRNRRCKNVSTIPGRISDTCDIAWQFIQSSSVWSWIFWQLWHIVASMFFFGVITFVTVCTEVDATQERSHAGNHIVVVGGSTPTSMRNRRCKNVSTIPGRISDTCDIERAFQRNRLSWTHSRELWPLRWPWHNTCHLCFVSGWCNVYLSGTSPCPRNHISF
jgi:hypothetical protein